MIAEPNLYKYKQGRLRFWCEKKSRICFAHMYKLEPSQVDDFNQHLSTVYHFKINKMRNTLIFVRKLSYSHP